MVHGASVILMRKDGAVLLQHRDNNPLIVYPDYWCFPGGRCKNAETYKDGAKRELFEETGYRVKSLKLIHKETYLLRHEILCSHHYYCSVYDESQTIICLEGQAMEFVNIKEIRLLKLHPSVLNQYIKAKDLISREKSLYSFPDLSRSIFLNKLI